MEINISSELADVQKRIRQNFHTEKSFIRGTYFTATFPYGEISIQRNFLRRSFLMTTFPYGKVSLRRNILTAKFPTEKFPTAKFPTAKFSSADSIIANVLHSWGSSNSVTLCIWSADKHLIVCMLALYSHNSYEQRVYNFSLQKPC